jgi:hypothetical protein
VTGFPEIKPDEKGKKHETDEIPPNRIGHPMHAKIYAGNGNQRNKKNGKNNDKRPKNPGKFRRGKHEDREKAKKDYVMDDMPTGEAGIGKRLVYLDQVAPRTGPVDEKL